MFHVVPIPEVGSLYYLLGVHYHVAHKHHKSKIQLQKQYGSFRNGNLFIHLLLAEQISGLNRLVKQIIYSLTSNLKIVVDPPNIEEAKFNQKRMERQEERTPPKYRNSLRLANIAATEKQPKATAVPTKALTRMLHGRFLYINAHVKHQQVLRYTRK